MSKFHVLFSGSWVYTAWLWLVHVPADDRFFHIYLSQCMLPWRAISVFCHGEQSVYAAMESNKLHLNYIYCDLCVRVDKTLDWIRQ